MKFVYPAPPLAALYPNQDQLETSTIGSLEVYPLAAPSSWGPGSPRRCDLDETSNPLQTEIVVPSLRHGSANGESALSLRTQEGSRKADVQALSKVRRDRRPFPGRAGSWIRTLGRSACAQTRFRPWARNRHRWSRSRVLSVQARAPSLGRSRSRAIRRS